MPTLARQRLDHGIDGGETPRNPDGKAQTDSNIAVIKRRTERAGKDKKNEHKELREKRLLCVICDKYISAPRDDPDNKREKDKPNPTDEKCALHDSGNKARRL